MRSALLTDVEEMERMVEAYLDFARDLQTDEELDDIDVVTLVKEIESETSRGGHGLTIATEKGVKITARRDALKRAITNLVGNGFKYAENVWLTMQTVGVNVEFIVDDDGHGIEPDKYEDAFKPFVRLDEARGQNISGVGLGLSVVRDVARSHGGEIVLSKSPQGGLRATLRIPA